MGIVSIRNVLIFSIVLLLCSEGNAFFEKEGDNYSLEAIGNGRVTTAFLNFSEDHPLANYPEDSPAFQDDAIALAVMRLIMDGTFGDHFDLELNLFADMTRQMTAAGVGGMGALGTSGSFRSPYRTTYLEWNYWEDGAVIGRMGVDRLALNWDFEPFRISVGRMPLNYSVAQIFTVNDFFAPFSVNSINTVYKPGVDSIRLGFAPGPMSEIQLVGVMGSGADDVPSWEQSALMLHATTVLWNYEWGIMGGKLAERWFVGTSIQGEAGPFGLRAEGHLGFPEKDAQQVPIEISGIKISLPREDVHFRGTVGADTTFSWRNASIGAEYMYRSDGVSEGSEIAPAYITLYPDDMIFVGGHYVALQGGFDIVPILRLQAMGMLNASDLSGIASLFMVYNIADEAEAVLGAMFPWGSQLELTGPADDKVPQLESEYGDMPIVVYLETRFYF